MCRPLVVYCKELMLLLVLLFLAIGSASAQISYKETSKHERNKKRFLKQANKTEAAYKETHLNTEAYTFKKGKAARKKAVRDERGEYKFSQDGQAMPRKPKVKMKKRRQ